jgi:hypothetical protein
VFKDGEPRWERLEELLDTAAATSDYDVLATADQLLSYVTAEDNEEVRRILVPQVVDLIDGLGVDTVDYLRSLLSTANINSFTLLGPLFTQNRWKVLEDLINKQIKETSAEPSPALVSVSKFFSYMGPNTIEPEKVTQLLRRVRQTA